MFDSRALWTLASQVPSVFPAQLLHRFGLAASHAGAHARAERLFEAAAARYREDLAVESLARLRAHQLINRFRSGASFVESAAVVLEIERRLERLAQIESLAPPFALTPAHELLASWLAAPVASSDSSRRAVRALESAA